MAEESSMGTMPDKQPDFESLFVEICNTPEDDLTAIRGLFQHFADSDPYFVVYPHIMLYPLLYDSRFVRMQLGERMAPENEAALDRARRHEPPEADLADAFPIPLFGEPQEQEEHEAEEVARPPGPAEAAGQAEPRASCSAVDVGESCEEQPAPDGEPPPVFRPVRQFPAVDGLRLEFCHHAHEASFLREFQRVRHHCRSALDAIHRTGSIDYDRLNFLVGFDSGGGLEKQPLFRLEPDHEDLFLPRWRMDRRAVASSLLGHRVLADLLKHLGHSERRKWFRAAVCCERCGRYALRARRAKAGEMLRWCSTACRVTAPRERRRLEREDADSSG